MKRFLFAFIGIALLTGACQRNTTNDNEPVVTPTASSVTGPQQTSGVAPDGQAGVRCGVELWAKKTLTDAGVAQIDFTPQATTIDAIRQFKPPHVLAGDRSAPFETSVWTITADAIAFKAEADADIHMVVHDHGTGSSMIIEFPDADHCVNATPELRDQMAAARAAVIAAFGQPSTVSFRTISGSVTVSGVGLYDKLHGQTGVAPGGQELHPVLDFRKN